MLVLYYFVLVKYLKRCILNFAKSLKSSPPKEEIDFGYFSYPRLLLREKCFLLNGIRQVRM